MPGTMDKSVQECVLINRCSAGARATARSILAALMMTVFVGAYARGSVIEYQFSGVITSADPSTGVAAGTPFTGSFSYDTSSMSSAISIEGSATATYGGRLPSNADRFDLAVGGATAFHASGGLTIGENTLQYAGQYGYHDADGNPMPAHTTFSIESASEANVSAVLKLSNPSAWYPINPDTIGGLNLGQLPDATLALYRYAGSGSSIELYEAKLTSLMTVPFAAPEPRMLPMAALGALWLLAARRRHDRPTR